MITQTKKIVTKLRFIYSMLTNGDDPRHVMAKDEMDEQDELDFAVLRMDEDDIPDYSGDEYD